MGFHVLGNFIHILLVIAVILFLVRVIKGENPLK
ncbi:MAG: lmo0937 family membrane protein [Candidatus Paceibacterota bacterium]